MVCRAAESLREPSKLGTRLGACAPAEGVAEPLGGKVGISGQADIADLPLGGPTVLRPAAPNNRSLPTSKSGPPAPDTVLERGLLDTSTAAGDPVVHEAIVASRRALATTVTTKRSPSWESADTTLIWGGHPRRQNTGIAAFEHVEGLPGRHIDHCGHKAPTPMSGLHDGLAEPHHLNRPDAFERLPHRRPRHSEPPSDRSRCAIDGRHPNTRQLPRPGSEHPTRRDQHRLLSPRPHFAFRFRTPPEPLTPPQQHRPRRRGTQRDPPPVFRPRPGPTADHRRSGLDRQLGTSVDHVQHHEPRRAEPARTTTLTHRGAPWPRTVEQPRDSWGPPLNG